MLDDDLAREDILDGCELDFSVDSTPDEESDLFVLFAEALDDANPKTLAEAEAEWKAVFSEGA
jgi:hypothetical protein